MLLKLAFVHTTVALVGASQTLYAPKACRGIDQSSLDVFHFLPRQSSCPSGYTDCEDNCMPYGANCCSDGTYCDQGFYCVVGGCCQNGQTCSGPVTGCEQSNEVFCVDNCMPSGDVCCSDGSYCLQGQSCSSSGCIEGGSGGGSGGSGGGGSGGGSGGGETTTPAFSSPSVPTATLPSIDTVAQTSNDFSTPTSVFTPLTADGSQTSTSAAINTHTSQFTEVTGGLGQTSTLPTSTIAGGHLSAASTHDKWMVWKLLIVTGVIGVFL